MHKHYTDVASPSSQAHQQSLPSPLSSIEGTAPLESNAPERSWENQAEQTNSTAREGTQSAYLDFDLIWPDSEHLFESLMALDTTTPSQLALATPSIGDFSKGLSNTVAPEKASSNILQSNGASLIGESHQPVHNVSEMVTALVSVLYQLESFINSQ